jgi:hypothetical protein
MAAKKTKVCKTCAHSCDEKVPGALVCRCHPPVMLTQDVARSFFPSVKPDGWCGEHKAK